MAVALSPAKTHRAEKETVVSAAIASDTVRIEALDGLRGLMALFVVLGHWNTFTGGVLGDGILTVCGFRVPAFFALSGFVLYLSSARDERIALKTPYLTYLVRRLFRLLPAYYAALLLCLAGPFFLVFSGLTDQPQPLANSSNPLLTHLLLLQSWHHDVWTMINPPCWMLGYEWLLSLSIPILLCLARNFGWAALIGMAVLIQTPIGSFAAEILPPGLTSSFLVGLVCARAARHLPADKRLLGPLTMRGLALGIAIVSSLLFHLLRQSPTLETQSEMFAGVAAGAFCVFLAWGRTNLASRLLTARPLRYLGKISYSLFLIHYPLLSYTCWGVNHFLGKRLPSLPIYLGSLLLILAASALFHQLFEKPFQGAISVPEGMAKRKERFRSATIPHHKRRHDVGLVREELGASL